MNSQNWRPPFSQKRYCKRDGNGNPFFSFFQGTQHCNGVGGGGGGGGVIINIFFHFSSVKTAGFLDCMDLRISNNWDLLILP